MEENADDRIRIQLKNYILRISRHYMAFSKGKLHHCTSSSNQNDLSNLLNERANDPVLTLPGHVSTKCVIMVADVFLFTDIEHVNCPHACFHKMKMHVYVIARASCHIIVSVCLYFPRR